MPDSTYLQGRIRKRSLPVYESPPADHGSGPKRLLLPQGELANFYEAEEGIRYMAYIELRQGAVRGNHWHQVKEEQIYIISGELLLVGQERESAARALVELRGGDWVWIAPGTAHALKTVRAGHAIEFSRTRFDPADTQKLTVM